MTDDELNKWRYFGESLKTQLARDITLGFGILVGIIVIVVVTILITELH